MDSIFRQISLSANADHWRRFRIVSARFTHLLQTMRDLGCQACEITENASNNPVLFDVSNETNLLCIAEPAPAAPSPFYLKPESFSIAFTNNPEIIAEYRRSAEYQNVAVTTELCPMALWSLLLSEERLAWTDLECIVLRAIQSFGQPDLEGEPLFAGLSRIIRDLLSPDQLELSLESPGDYWPEKIAGWTWIESTGNPITTTLTPRLQRLIYRRERVLFVEDLESAYDVQIRYGASDVPFQSAVLLPLVCGAKPLGVLKLFYRLSLSPLPGDVEALELLRRELSVVMDRGRARLLMQRMATVDGLTNLFNHRFFLEQVRTEFQRALRYQKKMAVIMIDIDDFKGYNDSYGHLAGDRVLAETARTIRSAVRDIDFVARYGGEEFGLILPEVDAQSGMIVAEKIRKAVEALRFISEDGEAVGSITISCGVTDNSDVKAAEFMIERADRALYWVKRHGRNFVKLASDGDES